MKVIVIGGVAAGMSVASKLRRLDLNADITVYEKGNILSYGACGLPYFISNANPDPELLIAKSEKDFNKMNIKTNLFCEVLKVDHHDKKVFIKNIKTGDYFTDTYEKLVIASGADPIIPKIPNSTLNNIYTLKTYNDGLEIKEKATSPLIKNVVIIGGGFIGVEMAESFIELNKNTVLIEASDHILNQFDPDISIHAEEELIKKGVVLKLNERAIAFDGSEKVELVKTNRSSYEADLVIVAIGVKPNLSFLEGLNIQKGKNGALVIDREGRTSINDIYAAGDCSEIYHKVKKENDYIPLGTTANKMGRIIGENLSGKHVKYTGTLGSASIKVFDLEFARTGLSEKEAKNLAIEYKTSTITTLDHAIYYPGAENVYFKIVVDKHNKILGAQGFGPKNVVLRINMVAAAIHAGLSSDELGFMDFSYAPPFSGVWDAINILGNSVK